MDVLVIELFLEGFGDINQEVDFGR